MRYFTNAFSVKTSSTNSEIVYTLYNLRMIEILTTRVINTTNADRSYPEECHFLKLKNTDGFASDQTPIRAHFFLFFFFYTFFTLSRHKRS